MSDPVLKVKRLDENAVLPNFAYPGDAGLDLFSIEDITLKPDERASVRTGIALEIPEGYVGLVWDKSGISINHGIKTLGGVIDSSYRGELHVGVINLSSTTYDIKPGNKIAQLLLQKIEHLQIQEVDDLGSSERSDKGFGSSGE